MSDERRRLDDIARELEERRAAAVTEGILDGGHYDSEPSPADLEPRPLTAAPRLRRPEGPRPAE